MLQRHVRLGLQAHAGAEDVGQGRALLGQGVDDGRAGGRQRGLEHVAQDGEDAVEGLVFFFLDALLPYHPVAVVAVGARLPPLDAGHHLRDEHEVDDQGRGKEGVLTDVEDSKYPG